MVQIKLLVAIFDYYGVLLLGTALLVLRALSWTGNLLFNPFYPVIVAMSSK